jgi:hypothetical protein
MFRTVKCSSSGRLVHAVLWYLFMHPYSLVDVRMCYSKHVEVNIILIEKVCIFLVLVTYVYHIVRFEKRKTLNISTIHVPVSVRCIVF